MYHELKKGVVHLIYIKHDVIQTIPYLEVAASDTDAQQLPLIIFVHGFTSAKEHNLHYAYYLAKCGFRVILPDAKLHGERAEKLAETEIELSFWDIVISTIQELPVFAAHFSEKNLIANDRIGVAGTSMGGIVTLGALTQYRWIKAAVSLMGSPAYVAFAKSQIDALKQNGESIPLSNDEENRLYQKLKQYDLSLQPKVLNERPLLFWHSKIDEVVPFEPTYNFFLKAKSYYPNQPNHLKFIVDETSGHKVSRKGVLETVRWFKEHL